MKSTLVAASLAVFVATAAAQSKVTAPKNKYSPADDVKLGQEAAREVEKQVPVMRDERVNSYLNAIGRRLVENIPTEFRQPEFRYTFTGVNMKEINAFALPGGPMYINRGMIEKANNEGEVAGVMAHEISHVILRHGTAQQSKATKFAIGQMAGQIAGAIIGGRTGQVIAQGSQFGLGTYFLKYGRDYEKQSDILGSRIMASAGYDPRDMANVFRTIEKESGPGGPQWMSSHPNPGNRYEYINKEAQMLRVSGNARRNTPEFQQVRGYLGSLSPAVSAQEVARNREAGRTGGSSGRNVPDNRPNPGAVARPDSRYTTYDEGNLFRISVPSNWRELASNDNVTFAPEGGYGTISGQSVFTHGMQLGVARADSNDLDALTDQLIQSLRQGNPRLSNGRGYERGTIGGRTALSTVLSNVSDATGDQEVVALYTTQLGDGSLFYAIGVAPRQEYNGYANVFQRVVSSIRFTAR